MHTLYRLICLSLTLMCLSSAVVASADRLVVIVHPGNQLEAVSKQELRKIFTGDTMYFENQKINSFLSSHPEESTMVLERVYQLRNKRLLKKMRLKKLYRGIVFTQPAIVSSPKEVINEVAKSPSGIGIIAAQNLPKSVKVLKIDNRRYF